MIITEEKKMCRNCELRLIGSQVCPGYNKTKCEDEEIRTAEDCGRYTEGNPDYGTIEEDRTMTVYNIRWDTDGEKVNLPSEVDFEEPIEEDMIADTLSDIYGYCVEGFEVCYDPLPF